MESIPRQNQVKKLGNPCVTASVSPKRSKNVKNNVVLVKRTPLTTKKAVEFLLNGKLKKNVCRFCLHMTYPLSEMDQIMQIAGDGVLYKVTIRDIMASVHPFKVVKDLNFPSKICEKCITKALQAYLFAQQCEQSERALRNCFEDVYEKLEKLDPLEKFKKRGRQKLHPNHNIIRVQHHKVVHYAEPIRNLINVKAVSLTKEPQIGPLECLKCWQVLPNVESLVNHEKIHPKAMWFHCRLCGKSYVKRYQINRHIKLHNKGKIPSFQAKSENVNNTCFECKQCGHISENYDIHLQHIEKHKFKMVMEHLVDRKMDKLCSVCLNKNGKMIELDKMISLHGGYPELTGDRTLYNILGSTVPEMNMIKNYTGNKICEKCLEHAITAYIFINKAHYIRHRLDRCITTMVESVKDIEPENKLFIEIAQNGIMPITETYDECLLLEDNEIDANKLKTDVLEDEFRTKSEDESSEEENANPKELSQVNISNGNTGKENIKKLEKRSNKMINGYKFSSDNLEEFLKFKKKDDISKKSVVKYTCPLCNKHFISDYFLQKHILKHMNRKVTCKICYKSFKSKFYLHEHRKMCHINKLINFSVCQTCGRTFKTEKKKLQHEKCHISIFCELCSKTFRTQKLYNSHMQRHVLKFKQSTKIQCLNCSLCEKEFLSDNDLSVHVNKVHLFMKPYNCDMCEKQFYTEHNLKKHKKLHSVLSKEKCEFCSKFLTCRKNLVIHLRKHIGVQPCRCAICLESFYSESKLKNHIKHKHGNNYSCQFCKLTFFSRNKLQCHINTQHLIF